MKISKVVTAMIALIFFIKKCLRRLNMREICERLLNDVYEASCRLADESDYEDDLLPKLQNINTFIHTIGHYWDNLPENVQSDIMSEFVKHEV
tara:strand:- start:6315 stop:6593 length:279 start_codon:yes stop_codon:yes gene_type:complete